MDAETRKTLEALADAAETVADVIAREDPKRMAVSEAVRDSMVADDRAEAAAIRSALAEVDALTQRLGEAQDAFNLCDGERIFLREQVDALTQQVADLEARAIPPEWIAGSEGWHILVDGPNGTVTVHHAEYDPDPAGSAGRRRSAVGSPPCPPPSPPPPRSARDTRRLHRLRRQLLPVRAKERRDADQRRMPVRRLPVVRPNAEPPAEDAPPRLRDAGMGASEPPGRPHREVAVSVRDTGWLDGQRAIGPFVLDVFSFRGRWRSHAWFSSGTSLHSLAMADAPDVDAAKRAAESALRELCRETLKALGDGE